ncbi:MAG: SEC-C domain-containing protein [Bryobacterales bacterium]|nr:SEC-C domain-containing protein [Bryobacterales bacterium]
MNRTLSAPQHDAYRDWIRPQGVLEDFACQRLATARWYYERATALSAKFDPESPEGVRFQNMALRWEGSYNRALRELRLLQTERALANPNCHPPLADLQKIQQVAKRNGRAAQTENPQPQSNQECAKRNPDPYPEAGRNSPCPCGSTKKYKRCCGVDAPPILYTAA